MTRVAIVGAGITGLTAAHELERAGAAVTVFESTDRAGGPIRSVRQGDWLAEMGPHTLMESHDEVRQLVEDLGLAGRRVYATDDSRTRFVVRDGAPRPLPMGPRDLVRSDVYSRRTKLRLLAEPLVPRRDDDVDESLTQFAVRRFNRELLDYGFELLVNGVWAGDPNRLSVRHALPRLFALERDHGSVIRGAIAMARRRSGPKPRMISFVDGIEELVRALAERLGDLRFRHPVTAIGRRNNTWDIGGERFDAVIMTISATALTGLDIEGLEGELGFFEDIVHPAVAIVTLGYDKDNVSHALDGFGMIAPEREELPILGTLFTSTLFPRRAPEGHVTLASFVGGVRHPERALQGDEDLVAAVRGALEGTLGVCGDPAFCAIARHPEAIPQYEVGHGRLFAKMDALERAAPGLYFGGNVRQGVAVPELIVSGSRLAQRVLREAR